MRLIIIIIHWNTVFLLFSIHFQDDENFARSLIRQNKTHTAHTHSIASIYISLFDQLRSIFTQIPLHWFRLCIRNAQNILMRCKLGKFQMSTRISRGSRSWNESYFFLFWYQPKIHTKTTNNKSGQWHYVINEIFSSSKQARIIYVMNVCRIVKQKLTSNKISFGVLCDVHESI